VAIISYRLNLIEQKIRRFFSQSVLNVHIADALCGEVVEPHPWVIKIVGAAIALMTVTCRVPGCVRSAASTEADVVSRVY